MSEKERKTVTVDPEVAAYLSQEGRNASETVNKLVRMEMGEDVFNEQLIRFRMESEKDRYESAAQKARGHLERYNQLKERLEEVETKQDKLMQDVREKLENVPLEPDNPGVQAQAKRVDMSPEELIEQINDDTE